MADLSKATSNPSVDISDQTTERVSSSAELVSDETPDPSLFVPPPLLSREPAQAPPLMKQSKPSAPSLGMGKLIKEVFVCGAKAEELELVGFNYF